MYDGNINCTEFVGHLPHKDIVVKDRNSMEWTKPGEVYLGSGQWNQDWFIYHNFFRHYTSPGYYVDVGAMAPFVLSNTVAFDYCANWEGICIEPNPGGQVALQVYRSCKALNLCISGNASSHRFVMGSDTSHARQAKEDEYGLAFGARCVSLEAALELGGRKRIDYMSVDVEGSELDIFENFPFEKFDIRVISLEVSHASAHRIDLLLLTRNYVKVAILGQDAIYVSHAHLAESGTWPLIFPPKMRIFPYDEDYITFQARFKDPDFGSDPASSD